MKTINIKGRPYVMVVERLKQFRKDHPDWGLRTKVLRLTPEWCAIQATIRDPEGRIIAEGVASEKQGVGDVNKTSYVENCQTSAWGRALACLGIGIDADVASADEIALSRDAEIDQINNIETLLKTSTLDEDRRKEVEDQLTSLTYARAEKRIAYLLANQLDPVTQGAGYKQGDINKRLDKVT